MTRLNLGCGNKYMAGYTNIDVSYEVHADQHYNVLKGIPEEEQSIDNIVCDNLLEHISDGFMDFINDCWCVLKVGGVMDVYVPDFVNAPDQAIGDPTHFPGRLFCERSFRYFNVNDNLWKEFGRVYGFKPWLVKVTFERQAQIHARMEKPYAS